LKHPKLATIYSQLALMPMKHVDGSDVNGMGGVAIQHGNYSLVWMKDPTIAILKRDSELCMVFLHPYPLLRGAQCLVRCGTHSESAKLLGFQRDGKASQEMGAHRTIPRGLETEYFHELLLIWCAVIHHTTAAQNPGAKTWKA
jgi:hypothetical protein